jgi:xylulokinase
MAIDIGTTNIKVAIFNREGEIQALSQEKCIAKNINNYGEFEPLIWWNITKKCTDKLAYNLKKRVVSLSIIGQGPTIIPIYRNGQIAHKAITWLDTCGKEHLKPILEMGIDGQIAAVISKLIWLKDKIKKPAYLLQPWDYICMNLTGEIVNTSFDIPGFRPCWYDDVIMKRFGLKEYFLLPKFISTGTKIADILPNIAIDTKLPPNLVVVAGAADFAAALVGTRTIEDGYLCDRGGTSQGINLCTNKDINCNGLMKTPFFVPGLWKVSGIMSTTGKAIDWFCSHINGSDDFTYPALEKLEKIKRPTNLIFLPYLNGERSPHWDVNARGVFFGFNLNTTQYDCVISIMEGVAFGIAEIVNMIKDNGGEIKKIRATGGQTLSPIWNQIKADVLGEKIEIPSMNESELLGAVIFAMSYIYGKDILEISKEIVKIKKFFYPDYEKHCRYVKLLKVYQELYQRNKDLFLDIVDN